MSRSRDPLSAALLIGLARASPVIALGCIYLWMRESMRAKFGFTLGWFAPPLFLITASYIIARTVIRRRTELPMSHRAGREEDVPSFDADAALERYMANRVAVPESPVLDPISRAPRGGFGRKRIG